MACATPVVAADSPGIRETVSHGETGLLCEPTPEGIRDGIASLLEDEALRSRLGANGREHAVREFSLDRVVELELELYGSLTS
jgi:glycosyltransferase involved in cell wall biosynthesis